MPERTEYSPDMDSEMQEGLPFVLKQMVFDFSATSPNQIPKKYQGKVLAVENGEISSLEPKLEFSELSMNPREVAVLLGPNGSGKSRTFAALSAEPQILNYAKKIMKAGYETGVRVSRMPQETDLKTILEKEVVELIDELAIYYAYEDPVLQGRADYNPNATFTLAERLQELFDLKLKEPERLGLKVKDLSGGERTKLCLMVSLMSNPDILLLDEPSNHLDLSAMDMLANMISQLKEKGMAIIVTSHSKAFAEKISPDKILRIEAGGQTRKLAQQDYDPDLLNVEPSKFNIKPFERWGLLARREGFSGLKVNIFGKEIELPTMSPNSKICLLGRSGIGKTAILKGLESLLQQKDQAFCASLPQIWPEEIINGNLDYFLKWCCSQKLDGDVGIDDQRVLKRALPVFERELKDSGMLSGQISKQGIAEILFSQFSGGQQRLLWFMAIKAVDLYNFLILDEPTNHADGALKEHIIQAIEKFGGNVVFTSHDIDLVSGTTEKPDTHVHVWEVRRGSRGEAPIVVYDWRDYLNLGGFQDYIEKLNRDGKRAVQNLFD
jgi:ATPase subunit of ABC transporter with duplicated ATPase domains